MYGQFMSYLCSRRKSLRRHVGGGDGGGGGGGSSEDGEDNTVPIPPSLDVSLASTIASSATALAAMGPNATVNDMGPLFQPPPMPAPAPPPPPPQTAINQAMEEASSVRPTRGFPLCLRSLLVGASVLLAMMAAAAPAYIRLGGGGGGGGGGRDWVGALFRHLADFVLVLLADPEDDDEGGTGTTPNADRRPRHFYYPFQPQDSPTVS